MLGTCFVTGDGIGGTEKNLGTTPNREKCIEMVKAREPTANGATFPNKEGTGACYAEFRMTGSNSIPDWQTCKFWCKSILNSKNGIKIDAYNQLAILYNSFLRLIIVL